MIRKPHLNKQFQCDQMFELKVAQFPQVFGIQSDDKHFNFMVQWTSAHYEFCQFIDGAA